MHGKLAEIRDIEAGLWVWRTEHPDWTPEFEWGPLLTSTCVISNGTVALLDPAAPSTGGDALWERLDANPPDLVVVLKPDHVRDVDFFVDPRLSWNRFGLAASFPGALSPFTTAGAAWRHRFGCLTTVRWSLQTV